MEIKLDQTLAFDQESISKSEHIRLYATKRVSSLVRKLIAADFVADDLSV